MEYELSRTENLIGKENIEILKKSAVAVFGIGGVGGYCVEALARCGVGRIDLFDNDTVGITNLNRQIIATRSTIGFKKTEAAKNRIKDINPNIKVNTFDIFYSKDNYKDIDLGTYDYVVDAIDTVTSKLLLIKECKDKNIPIISSMGTGNKLDATRFEVSDIYKTSVCPLAKVMRYELKKLGVKALKVVYSKEDPLKPENQDTEKGKTIPASISFVPGTAGLIIAGEVIKDLIKY